METKGKLVHCYFEPKKPQREYPFIGREDGTIVANLEGYAIVPLKKWKNLCRKNPQR